MTGYTIIHQPLVIRVWLQVALLLAVAFEAYQLGVNSGSRPPECRIKIGTIKTECVCDFQIVTPGPVKSVIRLPGGEEIAP
jgi:hypothetical protein